ncbi:hypothetical protein GGR56DRAFT_670177 [Xylariaceae sp. FL0804]|nr:hypothetical protein GGR56DRAFT_670177 [Xylariaceae sp. FL0804]
MPRSFSFLKLVSPASRGKATSGRSTTVHHSSRATTARASPPVVVRPRATPRPQAPPVGGGSGGGGLTREDNTLGLSPKKDWQLGRYACPIAAATRGTTPADEALIHCRPDPKAVCPLCGRPGFRPRELDLAGHLRHHNTITTAAGLLDPEQIEMDLLRERATLEWRRRRRRGTFDDALREVLAAIRYRDRLLTGQIDEMASHEGLDWKMWQDIHRELDDRGGEADKHSSLGSVKTASS